VAHLEVFLPSFWTFKKGIFDRLPCPQVEAVLRSPLCSRNLCTRFPPSSTSFARLESAVLAILVELSVAALFLLLSRGFPVLCLRRTFNKDLSPPSPRTDFFGRDLEAYFPIFPLNPLVLPKSSRPPFPPFLSRRLMLLRVSVFSSRVAFSG